MKEKMHAVTVYLTEEELKALEPLVRRQGTTLSDAIRKCVRYVLFELGDPWRDAETDPAVRYLREKLKRCRE